MGQEDQDENQPEEETGKDVFVGFAESASVHGIPNAWHAKTKFRRVAWIIIFLGGLSLLLYQVIDNVMKYYRYPTNTIVEAKRGIKELTFPKVRYATETKS